ncbi:leucine-rich repeat domain-containing protein [Legionella drancourtii]|uniref:leucine-rich repeat domain-containing protein n=1 Tax=Legionella drancourtii TaxID=168933 RepID=UPI00058FB298|nr:leucine-rich repeat domain-containing protein [Legionella drancourtii]
MRLSTNKKILLQVTNEDIGSDGSYSIPDGVTSIGDGAFFGCTGLQSITLPNSVTSISPWAFVSCHNLQTIFINSWEENQRARIIELLPESLKDKVVSKEVMEKTVEIKNKQLHRVASTPQTPLFYRFFTTYDVSPKLPHEVVGYINLYLDEKLNPYSQEATENGGLLAIHRS